MYICTFRDVLKWRKHVCKINCYIALGVVRVKKIIIVLYFWNWLWKGVLVCVYLYVRNAKIEFLNWTKSIRINLKKDNARVKCDKPIDKSNRRNIHTCVMRRKVVCFLPCTLMHDYKNVDDVNITVKTECSTTLIPSLLNKCQFARIC